MEIYDNSHIMGTNAVGAMVVAGAAGFMKAHYRTFNIKDAQATPGDDYAMMREVLTRRFARLMKEEAELAAASPPSKEEDAAARYLREMEEQGWDITGGNSDVTTDKKGGAKSGK